MKCESVTKVWFLLSVLGQELCLTAFDVGYLNEELKTLSADYSLYRINTSYTLTYSNQYILN